MPAATELKSMLRASPAAGRAADQIRCALAESGNEDLPVTISGTQVQFPNAVLQLVADLLEDLSEGRAVTVAPADLPIGTQVASTVLGVSRPWLTRLLDEGELPSTRTGSKRRVKLGDLMAHRRRGAQRERDAATRLGDAIDQQDAPLRHPSGMPIERSQGFVGKITLGPVPKCDEAPLSGWHVAPAESSAWAA